MQATPRSWSPQLGLLVEAHVVADRLTRMTLREGAPSEADAVPHPLLAPVLAHLESGRGALQDLPVDLQATPFEAEALRLVRAIPPGKVRTYGEIARELGKPGASRAVGQACARNPLLLVIPCHRVVQGGGGLGSFSGAGGVETKRRLLELEGAIPVRRGGRQARLEG